MPRAEIDHRECRAGDTLAREGCLQVEKGSYGGGHRESHLHKGVCFLHKCDREKRFCIESLCSSTKQRTYTLTVTSKMSKSPDSFTFTVGKLGMCTLFDLSWFSVTRLYQTQEWLYVSPQVDTITQED